MSEQFKPVFVVGHPRSGTTMLASMIGSHKNISMPPETMFFFDIYQKVDKLGDHCAWIERVLNAERMSDLGLNVGEVVTQYKGVDESYSMLLMSILKTYSLRENKLRPGEKTPLHLRWSGTIFDWYKEAKCICIIRDGRDVVSSLLNVPWSHENIYKHCIDWNEDEKLARKFEKIYPSKFYVVIYEDILQDPQKVLKGICDFIDEPYDKNMLNSQGSNTVPGWERSWKSKALYGIDKSNMGKWRNLPRKRLWVMNTIMKDGLLSSGYMVSDVPILVRVIIKLRAWPYRSRVKPLFSYLKSLLVELGVVNKFQSYTEAASKKDK